MIYLCQAFTYELLGKLLAKEGKNTEVRINEQNIDSTVMKTYGAMSENTSNPNSPSSFAAAVVAKKPTANRRAAIDVEV